MGIVGPIRYVVSTAIMTVSAPNYLLIWSGWRAASIALPSWIYQAGDDFLYSMYQRMVVFFFEHITGLEVFISGDIEAVKGPKENVLYLSNHQSTVDWVSCNLLAIRQGSIGNLRYVMKDTLTMLPLYGFYFYQHGCIYIKRGDFKQKKMEQALEHLRNRRINSWTVMFPEGTRFIPEKKEVIEKSKKLAEGSGLQPLNHHMTPRYKGTYLALEKLRCNLDAIYDVTVIYSGTLDANYQRSKASQLIDFLCGKCPQMHMHIRRLPIASVPVDESEFKVWIHDLFITKDELVSQFYNQGQLDKQLPMEHMGRLDPLPLSSTVPSVLFFLATFIPYFVYPKCRSLYWKSLVFGTVGGYSWLTIRSVS